MMKAFVDFCVEGLDNVHRVAGSAYSPFRGHLADDMDTKSRFDATHAGIGYISDLLGKAELQGATFDDNALVFVFDAGWEVGEFVTNVPIPENEYTITMVHGMLQPRGDGKIVRERTTMFTVVFTPEIVGDGEKVMALASIYPGRPDPVHEVPFKEGDKVTGRQLLDAGIVRVC